MRARCAEYGEAARLTVDDRVVHSDSFPVGDDTVPITRGDRDHSTLLVVPPDTTPGAARAAMARAIRADNVTETPSPQRNQHRHGTSPDVTSVGGRALPGRR